MIYYLVIYLDKNDNEISRRQFMDEYFVKNAVVGALTNKTYNKNAGYPKTAIVYHYGKQVGRWSTNLYKQQEEAQG